MAEERTSRQKSKGDAELETFNTNYRRLVGGAIVEGLINPAVLLPNVAATKDYSQDSTGNYNQSGGGNHNQTGGDYTQSAAFRNPVIFVDPALELAAERITAAGD